MAGASRGYQISLLYRAILAVTPHLAPVRRALTPGVSRRPRACTYAVHSVPLPAAGPLGTPRRLSTPVASRRRPSTPPQRWRPEEPAAAGGPSGPLEGSAAAARAAPPTPWSW